MKYIYFKEGVDPTGVQLEIWDALFRAAQVYSNNSYQLVITSLSDGKHMNNSLHYSGYAADLRTRDMKVQDVPIVVTALRKVLGPDYDVIQESDHIHLEYDKKS